MSYMTDEEKVWYEAFGRKLQHAIDVRDVSQEDVAERCRRENMAGHEKISQGRISKWTRAEGNMYVHQAHALARALDVPLDYLVDESREEPKPIPSERERQVMEWIDKFGWEAAYWRLVGTVPGVEPVVKPMGKTYGETKEAGKTPGDKVKAKKKKSSN